MTTDHIEESRTMVGQGRKEAIYRRALAVFGAEKQIDMVVEEGAELILALMHRKRGRGSNVITEIADLTIMVGQMRLLFGAEAVDAEIGDKLDRLEYRLDEVQA